MRPGELGPAEREPGVPSSAPTRAGEPVPHSGVRARGRRALATTRVSPSSKTRDRPSRSSRSRSTSGPARRSERRSVTRKRSSRVTDSSGTPGVGARRGLDVVELRPSRPTQQPFAPFHRRTPFLAARRSRATVTTRTSRRCARARRTCSHRLRAGDASSVARSATSSSNGRRHDAGDARHPVRVEVGAVPRDRRVGPFRSAVDRRRRPRARGDDERRPDRCRSAPCAPATSSSPCTSACSAATGSLVVPRVRRRRSGATRRASSCCSTSWPKRRPRGLALVDLGRGEHHYKLRVANGAYDVAEGSVPAA